MSKDRIKAYVTAFRAYYGFTPSTRGAKTWTKEKLIEVTKRLEKEKK